MRRPPASARWVSGLILLTVVTALAVGPSDLVDYVIRGFPLGCVFALMAVGIVLTYKTSGVLNLAFAAQAFVSAAIFFDLRARHDWPLVPAFVLAVVVAAPLLGLLLERLLFRPLRSANEIAKLVTSLGLLVAIAEPSSRWLGEGATVSPPSIAPDPDRVYPFGDYALSGNELTTIIVTVTLVVGLSALFRWSPIGLQMRAVVESPRMAELNRVNADRISAMSWMLSSLFAGLAGVLLAPLFAGLSIISFFMLLVAALAAAVFGRLSSIPLAFLGAILLAITMQVLGSELPQGHVITQNLRPALPFLILIVLVLFWPGLRRTNQATDPMAGVEPPPPAPAALARPRWLTRSTRVLAVLAVVGLLVATLSWFDGFWVNRMTIAVILSIIFLSITVITGMAGLISLAQATFAAIGALTTAQAVNAWDLDVMTGIVIGAVVAAAAGALLALPALRVRGIYVALVTLAFAVAFEFVLVPLGWVSGGSALIRVPRPTIGPIDFASDKSYLLLCVGLLALIAMAVIALRGGTTGRFLDALRGSETAAMSIGINPVRSKFVAFSVSAAIAGFGGGLLITQTGTAGSAAYNSNFAFLFGLVWVVLVVTMGARSVQAAIIAGIAFVVFPELFDSLGISPQWAIVLFGVGALTYARHPEGILEANTRRLERRLARSHP